MSVFDYTPYTVYTPHMPKVTVYIRNEDYEAWKNVVEKTKFMHDALTSGKATIPPRNVIKTPAEAREKVAELRPTPARGVCKHGNPKGSCFEKTALRFKCNN